jgi:hypothetical protein
MIKNKNFHSTGYIMALFLGAVAAGIMVVLVTRAVPNMINSMMHSMKECSGAIPET